LVVNKPAKIAVSEQGADNYVNDHFQPFLKSAKSHFDSSQMTWTEKKLKGKSEKNRPIFKKETT
jgi:hypothetical protein